MQSLSFEEVDKVFLIFVAHRQLASMESWDQVRRLEKKASLILGRDISEMSESHSKAIEEMSRQFFDLVNDASEVVCEYLRIRSPETMKKFDEIKSARG